MKKNRFFLVIILLFCFLLTTYNAFSTANIYNDDTYNADILNTETNANDNTLDSGNFVYTWEELSQWLEFHFNSGDTVNLGNNITIPASAVINVFGVTINTGKYGLFVASNSVNANFLKIAGEGVEVPVLTIIADGGVYMSGKSYITATGRDGIGGTAVSVESSGNLEVSNNRSWLDIRALGVGAIGVEVQGDFNLRHCEIKSDSIGVSAENNASLLLCEINADIPIQAAGIITLDTCITNNPVSGAIIKTRQILDINIESYEKHFLMGVGLPASKTWLDGTYALLLLDDRELSLPIEWNKSSVNTNILGKYTASGTISPPYDRFELDKTYPITATAEVVDASIPYFVAISSHFSFSSNEMIALVDLLWDTNNPRIAKTMRSDDAGASWRDISSTQKWEDFYRGGGSLSLSIPYSELLSPIYLKIIVDGVGESSMIKLTVDKDENVELDILGGDRSGIDRGENNFPPYVAPKTENHGNLQSDTPTPEQQPFSLPIIGQSYPQNYAAASLPKANIGNHENEELVLSQNEITQNKTADTDHNVDLLIDEPIEDEKKLDKVSDQAFEATRGNNNSTIQQKISDNSNLTVSGKQLQAMIAANPNYVTFINDEMWVSFPTKYLQNLDIVDFDIFAVHLTMPDEYSFSIDFSLNGKDLVQLFEDPFLISIPWTDGDIYCISTDGFQINAVLSDDKAAFSLKKSGNYSLSRNKYVEPVSQNILEGQPTNVYAEVSNFTPPVIGIKEVVEPYKDSFLPIALAGCFGLLTVGVYLYVSRKIHANTQRKSHYPDGSKRHR